MGDATKLLYFRSVLETIEKEGLQRLVNVVGQELMEILRSASGTHPEYISNLRGAGTMIAFDASSPALRDGLAAHLRNKGVLVGTNGTQSIRFRPALNFNSAHVHEFKNVFLKSLDELSLCRS